tara:strand:+ start:6771 stop:7496 length:726 start_codon:yes stop_codon:yes gene_type:complete
MMAKKVGISKGKKAHESNSFLAPWKPKRERPITVNRANEIERLLTTHGGDFTAKEVCDMIDWCNKDNIRAPMRKLITEGRAKVDIAGKFLRFSAPPNTAGTKTCKGKRKDGQRCGWQIEEVSAHDYCQWHRRQDPNHFSNNRVDRSKTPPAIRKEQRPGIMPEYDVVVIPDENKTVADVDEPWTILVPTDRHNELVIKLLKPDKGDDDNMYRDLILSFLEGEATIADLRKAVKDVQEELKE